MTPAASLVGILAVVFALAAPTAAAAAPTDTVDSGTAGHLVVDVNPGTFNVSLDEGERDEWLITVRSEADTAGDVTFTFASTGALAASAEGARAQLDACTDAFTGVRGATACASLSTLISDTPLSDIDAGARLALGTMQPGDTRHLRLTVALPDQLPADMIGTRADFQLGFHGIGTETTVEVGGPAVIAETGADIHSAVTAALAAVLGGIAVAVAVRVARREGADR